MVALEMKNSESHIQPFLRNYFSQNVMRHCCSFMCNIYSVNTDLDNDSFVIMGLPTVCVLFNWKAELHLHVYLLANSAKLKGLDDVCWTGLLFKNGNLEMRTCVQSSEAPITHSLSHCLLLYGVKAKCVFTHLGNQLHLCLGPHLCKHALINQVKPKFGKALLLGCHKKKNNGLDMNTRKYYQTSNSWSLEPW